MPYKTREQQRQAEARYRQRNKEKLRERSKVYQSKHPDRTRLSAKKWSLKNKDKVKARATRYRSSEKGKRTEAEYYSRTREKARERCRDWFRKNKTYNREKSRRFRKKNPRYYADWIKRNRHKYRVIESARRRKLKVNTENITVLFAIVERERARSYHRCFYCRNRFTGVFHLDHVIPVTKDGKHSPGNVCISCPKCNLSKGSKKLGVWQPETQQTILPL